jgi:methyltransferase (TIGR00027 family)
MNKGKPSRTAYKVAMNIITLGAKPGMDIFLPSDIVQTTQELLLASGAAGAKTVKWSGSQKMVSVYEAFDWILPGQFEAFAHRKAFCEQQVRTGIEAGATQILILGAGYDTLGWRLAPQFPGVTFYEIDHPATACLKAKGIAAMRSRDNLFLIAEDLGKKKLVDTLKSIVLWDKNSRSIIVAEGLVMYLSSKAVRDLFSQCAVISGVGSRFAFSYVPTGVDGRPDVGRWTGLILWLQKMIGEPWIWSIKPEELGKFLEETGWAIAPTLQGPTDKHGVEFYTVAKKKNL